ncbi:hypothetical protein C8R46DRAFT_1047456 [Mycena filopes]|nr:hypothetical protein C8R46DRAFT_1047453 [Mycena filopes]KAJ7137637.1 hypothetical protein C8R46DRAFT_1047456 [Mycena filopes]
MVSQWDGDAYSAAYTQRHYAQAPDLGAYVSDLRQQYAGRDDLPVVAGVASGVVYPANRYVAAYGTSGPAGFAARGRMKQDVSHDRLNQFAPGVTTFKNVQGATMVGNCCEYVTLKQYLPGALCTLRVVISESCYVNSRKKADFCAGCRDHARIIATQYPGLKLIDKASGAVYESPVTAHAFRLSKAGTPVAEINQNTKQYLRNEAQRLAYEAQKVAHQANGTQNHLAAIQQRNMRGLEPL